MNANFYAAPILHMLGSKQKQSIPAFRAWLQMLHVLMDAERQDFRLTGRYYDIDAELPDLRAIPNSVAIAYAAYGRALLAYLNGEHREADAGWDEVQVHIEALVGLIQVPMYSYLRALNDSAIA